MINNIAAHGSTIVGDHDIFDPGTHTTRKIDPWFHRKRMPADEARHVSLHHVWIFVFFDPDSMANAMNEVFTVTSCLDDVASNAINLFTGLTNLNGLDGLSLRLLENPIELNELLARGTGNYRPRNVRAIADVMSPKPGPSKITHNGL